MVMEIYRVNDIKVIKISGEIDFDNFQDVGKKIRSNLQNTKKVIIDLEELTYLNSMGLSEIIKVYKKSKENDTKLILCSLNENIHKLFRITKINKLINICTSQQDAINALI